MANSIFSAQKLKTRFQNYLEIAAPAAIGAGVVFTIVASRMEGNTLAHWLGLGVSLAAIIIGIVLAPRKKTLQPWARALTMFGLIYLLYNITISDWDKMIEGAAAVAMGLIITPDYK